MSGDEHADPPAACAKLGGNVPPADKLTATSAQGPDFSLRLTCLSCGFTTRVRVRGDWVCLGGSGHTRVLVHAPDPG